MKKFINQVETMLLESLKGMSQAHDDIIDLHEDPLFVYRRHKPIHKQVVLISGDG